MQIIWEKLITIIPKDSQQMFHFFFIFFEIVFYIFRKEFHTI